jgi:hypothetical protein
LALDEAAERRFRVFRANCRKATAAVADLLAGVSAS